MDRVRLGRTDLQVGVAGLGCGGHSRLGQATGRSDEESIALVRRALDLGVTLVDTARAYRTEEIVGRAVAARREEVVLSTKALPADGDGPLAPERLVQSVELSLRRLRTDRVDIFHLHGVGVDQYDHAREVLVPALLDLRDEGKVRFLAISEQFATDPGHEMLQRALADDCWDVMMVGFNLLNPSARERVFPASVAKDVGVLIMFAVRQALSRPERLRETVRDLVAAGLVDAELVDLDDPLAFLLDGDGAASVPEAAYRFARHEPGAHVVLTGTGNVAHLEENVASLAKDPLPDRHLEQLHRLFAKVDTVAGE